MFKFLATRFLNKFEAQYAYDVSYMRHLLDVSPAAFSAFSRVGAMSNHGESAPKAALFTARLSGVLAEDCGPCVQLVVEMARQAGVESSQVTAVLQKDRGAMTDEVRTAFDFVQAVLTHSLEDDAAREAVRTAWGDKGVIDLTFALQASRLYPMVKAGLSYAKTCWQVRVDGLPIEVVKQAA